MQIPKISPRISLTSELVATDVEIDDDYIFKPPIRLPYVKAVLIFDN